MRKSILWNVRVSETERKQISELAKRLNVKESKAFRFALALAMNQTDPKNESNILKNIVVIS